MFLSRLTLSHKNRRARADLANPYELHRTLARVVENAPHTLYRVEENQVLVQSSVQPDWSRLEPGYLHRPAEARSVDYRNQVKVGETLRFRLRANPCINKKVGETADGKRVTKRMALLSIPEQLAWLHRQAERWGFSIVGAMVSESGILYARKETSRITVGAATFDGHLTVGKPELLEQALLKGIGHGKALGLGMLSLPLG